MDEIATHRSAFLDCLKGLAIITVVLGHTAQGATADFDNYLPFRVIYSFHMPMFMFISGMTASLVFMKGLREQRGKTAYLRDLYRKGTRLVLPFFTWAIISYYLQSHPSYTAWTWFEKVLAFPDNGLWFLWILFQCSCVFAIFGIVAQFATEAIAARSSKGRCTPLMMAIVLISTAYCMDRLLASLPNGSGLYLTKLHFKYFIAGAIFHVLRPTGLAASIRWIPYVLFLALVPFWYRTQISPLANGFADPGKANSEYQLIVAFAGTLAFVDLVQVFVARAHARIIQATAFLGKRSLDIYAIHFWMLGYSPPVIGPMAVSLVWSTLLRSNPVTSWLCFGQMPLPFWRPTFARIIGNKTHLREAISLESCRRLIGAVAGRLDRRLAEKSIPDGN